MYNHNHDVVYTNDEEYRKQLSIVFQTNQVDCGSEIDENLYDSDTMNNGMDYLYETTQNNVFFLELYTKSSETLFVENLEIGLVVMFSYDYFDTFHKLLRLYIQNPDTFCLQIDDESTTIYNNLLNKIKR